MPANLPALRALENQIQEIEHPEQPRASLPDVAQRISGKTFQMMSSTPAEAWFQTITFTFDGGNTYQSESQWPGNQQVIVKGGMNNAFQYNSVKFTGLQPAEDIVVALRGHWQDDHTFVEEYVRDLNSEIGLITQKSTFEDNRIVVELTSTMQPYTQRAMGEMIPEKSAARTIR